MTRNRRTAFTLIEVLVVIAIIGILVAMMLPAIQAAREIARRAQCSHRLSQLIIATHNYESSHRVFPPGVVHDKGPIVNTPIGYHHSWIVQLMPYIGEQNAFRAVDFSVGVYDPANAAVRDHAITIIECPSNDFLSAPASGYAAVYHDAEAPIDVDNNGTFFLNSVISMDDVSDGLAYTLFFGDKRIRGDKPGSDLGWMSGTRATLRNTGIALNLTDARPVSKPQSSEDELYGILNEIEGEGESDETSGAAAAAANKIPKPVIGGFGSFHPSTVQFALGDGSVRGILESIDARTLKLLGNRADGEIVELKF